MLQWIPNSDTEVIFNDREGDAFVSRIYNVKTGADSDASARDLYAFARWEDRYWG